MRGSDSKNPTPLQPARARARARARRRALSPRHVPASIPAPPSLPECDRPPRPRSSPRPLAHAPPPGARQPSRRHVLAEGRRRGPSCKMYLLPLPAVGRVAVRHLGLKRFCSQGLAAADMTKVRCRVWLRGCPGSPARGLLGLWVGSRPSCSRLLRHVAKMGSKEKFPPFADLILGRSRGSGLPFSGAFSSWLVCRAEMWSNVL